MLTIVKEWDTITIAIVNAKADADLLAQA